MNILIVDDEGVVCDLVSKHLAESGHQVRTAEDVDGAEAMLRSWPEADLVITDIRMAARNGIELLHSAKRLKPEIEVILMTGYAEVETATSAVNGNAFAYLRKPFCIEELVKVVERADRHIEMSKERKEHARKLDVLVKQLEASELRYRTLVEGVNGAVLSTDCDLVIRSASQRCGVMLGRAPEQLIGTPLRELRPSSEAAAFSEKVAGLTRQQAGMTRIDSKLLRPDGSVLHTVEIAAPLSGTEDAGQPTGFFWIIEDVTLEHRLKAQAELAHDYLEAVRRSRSDRRRIVGESGAIKDMLRLIKSIADTSASVLVCGESGTGKELVAESVHINSSRAGQPFVVVNCATLPESLLESELFGYRQGAFTGAVRDKRGLVEIAHGGTLFVDEVAEMAPSVQAKMLRVLEHGQFRRLGCTEDRQSDIRVVAATNRELNKEVHAGRFREDLLYRLDVIRIEVPPLRDRKEDIPLIAEHFLRHSGVTSRSPKRLTAAALDALVAYDWPGNIRELSNVIERAVILSEQNEEIGVEYLSLPAVRAGSAVRRLRELEESEMDKALALTKGNKTRAAKMLGITRQTLISRLKRRAEESAELSGGERRAGRQPDAPTAPPG